MITEERAALLLNWLDGVENLLTDLKDEIDADQERAVRGRPEGRGPPPAHLRLLGTIEPGPQETLPQAEVQ